MSEFLASLPFTVVDYVVFALLLYGLIGGLIRGLSGELILTGTFVGLLIAVRVLHSPVARALDESTALTPDDADIVALALLAATALLLLMLLRALARHASRRFRGPWERIGGAAAGTLRAAAVVALLLLAAGLLPRASIRRAVVQESWFGRRAHAVLPAAYGRLSERYDLPPLPEPHALEPAADDRDAPEEGYPPGIRDKDGTEEEDDGRRT